MKIKKIALVEMKSVYRLNIYANVKMPRGVVILATILKNLGYTAHCYVETIKGFDITDLLINMTDYDVVGFSVITNTAKPTYDAIRRLRAAGYPGKIIVGGPHATEHPEESLDAGADVVVRNEGDKTLPQLITTFENDLDLENVLGISWEQDGVVRNNSKQPFLTEAELSQLPFLDFETVIGYENMSQVPVPFSRGCPYRCDFCAVEPMYGKEYRFASSDWCLGQLRHTRDNFPILWKRMFFFTDDNLYGSALGRRIRTEMLKRMPEENLKPPKGFICQIRVNDADPIKHPGAAALLKRAGGEITCLGLESTDAETLKNLNKDLTPKEIRAGLKNLRRHRIKTLAMMIAGTDTGNFCTFFRDIIKLYWWGITFLQILALVPLPGTKLTKELISKGRKFSLDYDLYDGLHVLIDPLKMSKVGVWMSVYLVTIWFYLLTLHGLGLLATNFLVYCKIIGITVLQSLKRAG